MIRHGLVVGELNAVVTATNMRIDYASCHLPIEPSDVDGLARTESDNALAVDIMNKLRLDHLTGRDSALRKAPIASVRPMASPRSGRLA